MKKRMVVISQGQPEATAPVTSALHAQGWECEVLEISKGEPLPKSLEHIDGLLILSDSFNIFEQTTNPLQVYLNI